MIKKISIIVATYNAANSLENCLNSIINQMTNDCELIIVDGGSTDGTTELINRYSNYISYTISESDRGIYDAWNKGIKQAKGEWIMFVGADDELLPNALSNCLSIINKSDDIEKYDYICARNNYVKTDGSFIKKIGKEPSWRNMKYYMAAAHVASLHNRENLFGNLGYYDLRYSICADYELLIRKGNRLKYLFFPELTVANMKEGGMSMTARAIIQTYQIRKHHHTIGLILNFTILLKSLLLYKFYNFHR